MIIISMILAVSDLVCIGGVGVLLKGDIKSVFKASYRTLDLRGYIEGTSLALGIPLVFLVAA